MEKDECLRMLKRAITNVYKKEYSLIQNNIAEWAVAAQLFYYLKKDCVHGLDVDCEYNKMIHDGECSGCQMAKKMKGKDGLKLTRPDIIVHKRADAERILWIEVKRKEGESNSNDLIKIRDVTREYEKDAEYVTGYHFGTSIVFGKQYVDVYFISGDDQSQLEEELFIGTFKNGNIVWTTAGQ